jgi:hypothetical protein
MNHEEHATVTSRRPAPELSAAVSLARAAGVPVAVAARQLENGTAKMLIQSRVAERRNAEQNVARVNAYYRWKLRRIRAERHIRLLERELH